MAVRPSILSIYRDWGWRGLWSTFFAIHSKKREFRESQRQWFLLAGERPSQFATAPNVGALHAIYPPEDRFWADPFLSFREGRRHVFFEEYLYREGRGRISVMEIDDQGAQAGPPLTVLCSPFHYSYPYLFTCDEKLYMVPEQKASRRVDVYECTEYPRRFERVATWFNGVRMVDVTVFEHEGLWWLFCAMKTQDLRYDDNVCAFYSQHPLLEPWKPHPLNPLVRDQRSGRPGGRVFKDLDGRLYRPSQDCSVHYGAGLNLSLIEELTPNSYRERPIWHLTGSEAGGWRGLHHLDVQGPMMVMDAERELHTGASA